jgi:hypothetical protein
MKKIKFITTFNSNGYYVYGQSWIESFLEFTKDFDNITAEIYVNDMDFSKINYGPKVKFLNFDTTIPQHKTWVSMYRNASNHCQWDKDLGIKFSYKIFVMMDSLKKHDDCYVIWLDGDSIFKSYDFNNFPIQLLDNTFLSCQREHGSEHVESGIIIFDAEHKDKQIFINQVELFYSNPQHFNSFGQFFDGFVIGRTLNLININYIDLNKGYGLVGIQSDPNRTFLNPELRKRFHHNIGITGKKSYQNWKIYADKDPLFQLIHGINDKHPKEKLLDNLKNINKNIGKFK